MSKNLIYSIITKMHIHLNNLIKANGFNLMSEEVQSYSRKLDKVLNYYERKVRKERQMQTMVYKS